MQTEKLDRLIFLAGGSLNKEISTLANEAKKELSVIKDAAQQSVETTVPQCDICGTDMSVIYFCPDCDQ